MKKLEFINRIKELSLLQEEYVNSNLVVLTGRRRVGKTALVKEWMRKSNNIAYSQALEDVTTEQQIEQLWLDFQNYLPIKIQPKSWSELLALFAAVSTPIAFIIDEFPYLVEQDRSLPSRLQKWLDHDCPPHVTICLMGSSQNMMKQIFLSGDAPLYGRARRILNIKPLSYNHFCQSLKFKPTEAESYLKYSLVGGIPKYWQAFDPAWQSSTVAAEKLFFDDMPFFDNEVLRLVKDENIGSTSALAILEAIGRGAHKPTEIASRLGMPQTSLTKALQSLIFSYLIKKELPFGESERNSKKGLYRLVDPFLLFHYGVYSPHRSRWSSYSNMNKQKLIHDHASAVFEENIRELYDSASRYYEGKTIEVDAVHYADPETLIFSEIKFRNVSSKERAELLTKLKQKIAQSRLGALSSKFKFIFEVIDKAEGLEKISSNGSP